MTFDQWTQCMSKEIFLPSDEDPKEETKVLEMVDAYLMDEEP